MHFSLFLKLKISDSTLKTRRQFILSTFQPFFPKIFKIIQNDLYECSLEESLFFIL